MGNRLAKKVLLIGWDAADWKVINPMMEAGEMPTLKKFLSDGVHGNIATMDPPLSPILWTSIATGKRPDQHGILNFTEPDTVNGGIKPVSSTSRKVKAIWNMLHQSELKSNVISWWPSNPVEPINGVMVSNLFQKTKGNPFDLKPMLAGSVHPKRLEDIIADCRIHPNELTEQHILPFIPDAFSITDQQKDKGLIMLSTALAETASVHAAATWVMENEEWDFMAVYYDGIDHFCHPFMKYHPPKISPDMPDDMFNLYKDVVKGGYKFHDMMLERLLQLAGEDTTVIIMSDHGFHSDHLRPLMLPNEPAAPAYEHREFGIFCMKGPHVKANHKIFGTSLLDVTPTLLTLFGLPIGNDMPGVPLLDAFDLEVKPDYISSWEEVKVDCGMHPEELQQDPMQAQEALQQLIDLGYIEDPGKDKQQAAKDCVRDSQYYLAKSILSFKRYEEALPIFKKLFEESPKEIRFAVRYLFCLEKLKKIEACREVIDKLKIQFKNFPQPLQFQEGNILLGENRVMEALGIFEELSKTNNKAHIPLGNTYLTLGRLQSAIDSFNKALEHDKENAHAFFGLGLCYIQSKNYEIAIDHLLNSIELVHFNPAAHFNLGEALALNEELEYAVSAFNTAISMAPGMKKAHQWLVKLYTQLNKPDMVEKHNEFIQKNIKKPVVLVSGLPRSGTSMMMQMLHAGGAEILTDNQRSADINNPKGYLEYEPVKKLAQDSAWMKEAQGKTIKVIAQLLQHLPMDQDYKVIFMQRELNEVLKSQQVMLNKSDKNAYPLGLASIFNKQVKNIKDWLERQPNIEVLYVNYTDAMDNSLNESVRIGEFLEEKLNVSLMSAAVNRSLYRNSNPVWK